MIMIPFDELELIIKESICDLSYNDIGYNEGAKDTAHYILQRCVQYSLRNMKTEKVNQKQV